MVQACDAVLAPLAQRLRQEEQQQQQRHVPLAAARAGPSAGEAAAGRQHGGAAADGAAATSSSGAGSAAPAPALALLESQLFAPALGSWAQRPSTGRDVVDWDGVVAAAKERAAPDCPICLGAIARKGSQGGREGTHKAGMRVCVVKSVCV